MGLGLLAAGDCSTPGAISHPPKRSLSIKTHQTHLTTYLDLQKELSRSVRPEAVQVALQTLLQLHIPSLTTSPAEVTTDVLLLATHTEDLRRSHCPQDTLHESSQASTPRQEPWVACATMLTCLIRRVHKANLLAPSPPDASKLTAHVLTWYDATPAPRAAASLPSECMRTCSHLATTHLPKFSCATKATLLAALLRAIPIPGANFHPSETSIPAIAALEVILSKHAALLDSAWVSKCLAALVVALHTKVSAAAILITDDWHSAAYGTLLRALTHCVAASGAAFVPFVDTLVDSLSRLWAYGLPVARPLPPHPAATATANSNSSLPPRTGKYVPPSRRASGNSASSSSTVSDSDSATSAPIERGGSGAATVRLAAQRALAALLKQDPSTLHQLWDRLLPHTDTLAANARPMTIPGVLLHDPSPKVRAAAAVCLHLMVQDRRTRAFMAVAAAEGATAHVRTRPYTSLSASLAAMLMSLHSALGSALLREKVAEVQLEVLKAAHTLVTNSPYGRLPVGTVESITNAAMLLWEPLRGREAGGEVCSLIHCLVCMRVASKQICLCLLLKESSGFQAVQLVEGKSCQSQ
jgi:hypothetical protein